MAPWIDSETGELADDCPQCANVREATEQQMHAMELELRQKRAKITRLENAAEHEAVAKRDGAVWKEVLKCWRLAFPDKRPSATSIKSARAAAVFFRLDSGASLEDVKNAVAGAMRYPYVVYGKRRDSGSDSDRADDLQEIMSVSNDAQFDWLRDVGAEMRANREGG